MEEKEAGEHTVWNIEWKCFCAQWNPVYTAANTIVLADENIKKASLARSVFEAQVCVFCRYWKESIVKPSSAIESTNRRPKNTLEKLSASQPVRKRNVDDSLTEFPK